MMNITTRRAAQVGGFVVASLVLAGCGGGEQPESGQAETITVAAVTGVESDPLAAVLERFDQETGIAVDLVQLPYDGLYTKLQTDLSAGADTYDVVFMDDPWFPGFAAAGYFEDLEGLGYEGSDQGFVEASYELGQWPTPGSAPWPGEEEQDPTQYALPVVGNAQLFNYRSDLLEDEGLVPPETWDDAVAIAEEFRGSDTFGYVVRGASPPIVTNFAPVLYGYGGEWFDDNWHAAFNSEVGVEALERFLELASYSPEGVANFNADQLNEALLSGAGVQAVNWPSWGPALESSEYAGNFGYSVVPAQPGQEKTPVMGNWLLAVPTSSQNKEEGLQFIEWATSEETFRAMLESAEGAVPTQIAVLSDPELQEKYPWFPALGESLARAQYWPRIPNFNEFFDIMGRHLNSALTGATEPEAALDAAAEELDSAMRRAGFIQD